MDERHWWIAKRIAQTFAIDSSSPYLEKLICEPTNLEKVNLFLCMNGSNKLFVCGTETNANGGGGGGDDTSSLAQSLTHSHHVHYETDHLNLLIVDDLLKVKRIQTQPFIFTMLEFRYLL